VIDPEIFETLMFVHGLNGRIGLPMLVEGPPGSGKTQFTKQLCHDFGLHCIVVLLRLYPQSELAGFPFLTEDDVTFRRPRWAKEAIMNPHCVVFFDEFNTCEADSHAAALRVINEGVVGDTGLPATVRFMGACNPIEQATGGVDLPMAMANRLCHLTALKPSVDQFRNYLGGIAKADHTTSLLDMSRATDRMRKVDAEWSQACAWASAVVGTFVHRNPELLFQVPKPNEPAASKGWASPRSWEAATRALASSRIHHLHPEKELTIVQGLVGAGPTAEFAAFRAEMDLPNPIELLDGHTMWKHDRSRPDRTYVVLMACRNVLAEDPKSETTKKRVDTLWKMLRSMVDDAADVILDTVSWLNANQHYHSEECSEVIEKILPMLRASGMAG